MVLLQQMLALFIMMLVGFLCARAGVLDSKTTKKISWLVINVGNPGLILAAGMNNEKRIPASNLLIVLLLVVIINGGLILFSVFLPRIIFARRENYGIFRSMMVFSNNGFMGIPLLAAVYGGESVLYATLFIMAFNILIYTYGIRTIKDGSEGGNEFHIKDVFNAGVISALIAMVLYFSGVQLPDFIKTTASNFSSLTAPLSMLVIGASFTEFKLSELFTNIRLIVFSIIKLLLIPIISLLIIKQFVTDPMILATSLVTLSTPVASMVAMLAKEYDSNYTLAAKGVALTTILSVITMPVVSMVVGI